MRQTLEGAGRRGARWRKELVVIDAQHPLLLASVSPRRRSLLEHAGVPFVAGSVEVDETPRAEETPERYLERVVADKLAAALMAADPHFAAVLVADTVVVAGGRLLGKPRDRQEARTMLGELAGSAHEVMTRFAWRATDGHEHAETVSTRVWFRELDAAEIERYAATDEGRDKAGAYAIQGIGAALVSRIEGSYTNVVGLPIAEVIASLRHARLLASG